MYILTHRSNTIQIISDDKQKHVSPSQILYKNAMKIMKFVNVNFMPCIIIFLSNFCFF